MNDERKEVAVIVADHEVDMSGTAIGGGWDLWDARCRVCGPLERDEWPSEHVARILSESILARVWAEGAKWAAVECGAIPHEGAEFFTSDENSYNPESLNSEAGQ